MTSPENLPSGPVAAPGHSTALQLRQQSYLLQTGFTPNQATETGDDSISLKDVLALVFKYKLLLLTTTTACLMIALVVGLTSTPVYEASVLMQIDSSTARIVQFNKDVDPYQENDALMLQTQLELMRSRSLAERVIDDLGLDPTRLSGAVTGTGTAPGAQVQDAAAVLPPKSNGAPDAVATGWMEKLVNGFHRIGTPSVDNKQFLGREALIARVINSMVVEPVRNSRLVKIKVSNISPAQAARLANGVAQTFITMSTERRGQSSLYAKSFLEEQLKATGAKLEASERALNSYAKANAILSLDDKTNVINQTFTDYSAALSRVEQERLKAESIYNAVAAGPENAPQVLENKTVQTYKEQRAKLEAEYLTNLLIYKPEFPKMVQIKAQISELDSRIKAEVTSVLGSIKGQYLAAKTQEDQVRARLQETRREVLQTQDKNGDLNLLKRELDTNRQLYDGLLQRLKEVGVTSGVASNNISVVDEAVTPLFPTSPNLMKNLGIGLLAGLLLSVGFVFMREQLDDTIKKPEEVEAKLGLPLLGIIPQVKKKLANGMAMSMLTVEDPRSMFSESYRSMRTALQFSTAEGAPKRLMVTSSVQAEGKSTTSLALAINFAQLGQKVLVIDADMRNPSLHRSLGVANTSGLSSYLSGDRKFDDLLQKTSIKNLAIMTAGPHPPSPVDLLMGPRLLELLDLAEAMGFDKIILDAPPVLGIADAIVLGNQVQDMLFVVRVGSTKMSNIRDALRRLRGGGIMPLGVALVGVGSEHDSYYGSYGAENATSLPSNRISSTAAAAHPATV
jgi:polysaccharide biosynthesis transport protein